MSQPHSMTRASARTPSVSDHSTSASANLAPVWTVRRARPAPSAEMAMRKYDLLWLGAEGEIHEYRLAAPALPVFESAFNAFARGALIPTVNGPVAIEDLLPGDLVETLEGDALPVQWIGSMAVDGEGTRAPDARPEKLYRVTADSFGFGRPAPDLMLGGGARYLHRADAIKNYFGTTQALAPVSGLVDGNAVIEVTPISTVRTYHIALAQHRLMRVNGVELESYHPGTTAAGQLHGDLRTRFMALFPHLDSLGDFGAMALPRLSPSDLLMLDAG